MTIASTNYVPIKYYMLAHVNFKRKLTKKFLTIPDRQNQCSKSTKIKTTE